MTTRASDFDYDAVIVGSGAGGGIVAGVLAEAGWRVLVLERGPDLSFGMVARDHLRNQRLSAYGHNAGPGAGNPRVIEDVMSGSAGLAQPHQPGYENNAACVGGGTLIYGAQAWRFMPQDFRMASLYGVPEGSSLADWPISYDDLEPYYERAEWEIGVAGDPGANPHQRARRRGYPMPPVPNNPSRRILAAGAERLGWNTLPVPLAINTAPYLGRPACARCSYCVGFACPVDAKNGSQNTLLARALATGLCDLRTGAVAERIMVDSRGDITGVSYLLDDGRAVERRVVRARQVIVSGGAIESARLLLNSASGLHPRGLGNEHDLVGRNLDGHVYTGALGLFEEVVQDEFGPGVSIATCRFNHGNAGVIGGGLMANEFTKLPAIFWRGAWHPDVPRWGAPAKEYMRHAYTRTIHVNCPTHDIPSPESRVRVEPSVQDKYGIPVARISGAVHSETLHTAEFLRERAEEWLRASGAQKVWSARGGWGRAAGQHQAGTCRMGTGPETSVCNQFGRVHGHGNLFVVDGSLHVTNGGFNPALTIMALAFRCAEKIADYLE